MSDSETSPAPGRQGPHRGPAWPKAGETPAGGGLPYSAGEGLS